MDTKEMRGGRGSRKREDSMDRDGGMDGDEKGSRKFGGGGGFHRKKVCKFCTDADFVLDYKNYRIMGSFLTEHGKIVPRRISGNCAFHQRQLTTAIKRARQLALIGFVSIGL